MISVTDKLALKSVSKMEEIDEVMLFVQHSDHSRVLHEEVFSLSQNIFTLALRNSL